MMDKIFCHLEPLFALLPPNLKKSKFWKKEKKPWRYYHFTHVYHKWQSYDVWFLRYGTWLTNVFVILNHLLPFYLTNNQKIKILKKWKKAWRYYHFTYVYHKLQSYDVWFLRYGAQWIDGYFFSFWAIFCPFTPLTTQISKFWKILKNAVRYNQFTQVYQKSWSYAILFLRYGTWQM